MLKPRENRDHLSVAEAAERYGVGADTIRRWCGRYGFGYRPTPTSPWRIDPDKSPSFDANSAAQP